MWSKRTRIIVLQLKEDSLVNRLLLVERVEKLTNTSYVTIGKVAVRIRPELVLLTLEKGKLTPVIFVDHNFELIDMRDLLKKTDFPRYTPLESKEQD